MRDFAVLDVHQHSPVDRPSGDTRGGCLVRPWPNTMPSGPQLMPVGVSAAQQRRGGAAGDRHLLERLIGEGVERDRAAVR